MQTVADRREAPFAIRNDLGAIFVSLELSRSTWLITSLSPGGGNKMSKHLVRGGDVAGLLQRLARLQTKAQARTARNFPVIVIQEAGLDGFWIHRVLQNEGIESHVVDPASVATSRRRRRAKTDRIDGEAQIRTLLTFKRGEPRVCSMVRVTVAQKAASENGFVFLSSNPPQAGSWCSPLSSRRPNVRLIWEEHPTDHAMELRPWIP
jgi:transposase